jgi:hypothetical protein
VLDILETVEEAAERHMRARLRGAEPVRRGKISSPDGNL